MVHNIRTPEEFHEALKSFPKVAIDFYDVHSAESKHLATTFAHCYELDRFRDFRFVKVDINELKELSKNLGVTKPATFQLYKDGQKISQIQTDEIDALVGFLEAGL